MPRIGLREAQYVLEVLSNDFRSSQGASFMKRLEDSFCQKFNVNYAIAHVNGTATLHASLAALNVGSGDEVIVPPLTMASTTFAVLQCGATPVFADVDPKTFNISPESIRENITPRTKAIIPVSLYGLPCDIDQIMATGLPVVEDDAQCVLGKYKGRIVGSTAHLSSFSFQSSKHLTCGEGGMVTTNDPDLADKVRRFSSLGYAGVGAGKGKISRDDIQDPNYSRHVMLGWNYRMSELCSAVALGQLEHIEELVQRRIDVANLFLSVIDGCEWLTPQFVPEGYTHSYWALAVKLDHLPWREFRNRFKSNGGDGIYAAWKLTYDEPFWHGERGNCPAAESLQPKLLQFKTNYWDWERAEKQADILRKTIRSV